MRQNRYRLIFIVFILSGCLNKSKIKTVNTKIKTFISQEIDTQLQSLIDSGNSKGLKTLLLSNKDIIKYFPILISILLARIDIDSKDRLFYSAIEAAELLGLMKELLNKTAFIKSLKTGDETEEAPTELSFPIALAVKIEPNLAEKYLTYFIFNASLDVNAIYTDGNTLLHICQSPTLMALLIFNGADINKQNLRGETPLHKALYSENFQILIDILTNNRVSLNIVDDNDCTAFETLVMKGFNFKAATYLLKKFPDLAEISVCDGKPVLAYVIEQLQKMYPPKFLELLIKCSDLNQILDVENGSTALHLSAFYGRLEFAKLLLKNGAVVDLINKEGKTALFIAIENEDSEMMQLLLDNGADLLLGIEKATSIIDFELQCKKCDQYINWEILLTLYKKELISCLSIGTTQRVLNCILKYKSPIQAAQRFELLQFILKKLNKNVNSLWSEDGKTYTFAGQLFATVIKNFKSGTINQGFNSLLLEILKAEVIKELITCSLAPAKTDFGTGTKTACSPLIMLTFDMYKTIFIDSLKTELALELDLLNTKVGDFVKENPKIEPTLAWTSKDIAKKLRFIS